MGECRIGTLEDVLPRIELEAGDGRHGRQDRTAQRCDRIEPSQRRCDLSGLYAEGPRPQPSLTKSAATEGGHAPDRSPRPRALPERETLAEPDPQPVGTRPAIQ